MAYTFEEIILNQYLDKIGQERDNYEESIEYVIIPRLNECYLDLLRETGASWQPTTTLTLAAVTAATNKHVLYTALGMSSGEVLSIDEISWEGVPLVLWDKKKIDEQYDYSTGAIAGDPFAYAFWGEYSDTTHDEATYIALYPFVSAANTTDCKATWCKRPILVTYSNYTESYPIFASQYSHILAEEMALRKLNFKVGNVRIIKHENEKRKMKNHYLSYRQSLMESIGTRETRQPPRIYFYGES